jgi:hypothetical protein
MNEDLLAELWTSIVEFIPEKQRKEAAGEFIDVLLDYNIKDSVLEALHGVDSYLDQAIDYAIDGDEIRENDEEEDEEY